MCFVSWGSIAGTCLDQTCRLFWSGGCRGWRGSSDDWSGCRGWRGGFDDGGDRRWWHCGSNDEAQFRRHETIFHGSTVVLSMSYRFQQSRWWKDTEFQMIRWERRVVAAGRVTPYFRWICGWVAHSGSEGSPHPHRISDEFGCDRVGGWWVDPPVASPRVGSSDPEPDTPIRIIRNPVSERYWDTPSEWRWNRVAR